MQEVATKKKKKAIFISSTIMVFSWLSSKESDGQDKRGTQVEQRSHQSLNLAKGKPETGIENTSNMIGDGEKGVEIKDIDYRNDETNDEWVANFVNKRPHNIYTIDGEKDKTDSMICTTEEKGQKTCLKLHYNLIRLFKQMQKMEYYCSLPADVSTTHFECRKVQ